MNNRRLLHPPMGVGILTILMVLMVLLLASFAVMSLLSARTDANLTDKARQSVTAYYAADGKAERMIMDIDTALNQENWRETLDLIGVSILIRDGSARLSFFVPICDEDFLFVVLNQPLDGGRPAGGLTRIVWQTMTSDEKNWLYPQA